MKRHFNILFILFYSTIVVSAQYRGGHQDGNATIAALNLNPLPSVYFGGTNDGFHAVTAYGLNGMPEIARGGHSDGYSTMKVVGLNPLPAIFSGGSNDGYHFVSMTNLNPLPAIFSGGSGDGFDILYGQGLNALPGIYSGGSNDGIDLISRSNNNLPCDDDLFVWTGAVNEQWNEPGNWECFVAPGIFSEVIIPEGILSNNRPYPIVYLEAEVSKLTLRPGAYLQIEPGVILKLNGK